MSKKTVITIFIIAGIVVVGGYAVYQFWQSAKTGDSELAINVPQDKGTPPGQESPFPQGDGPDKKVEKEKASSNERAIRRVARYFISRWGSYSNFTNFANINDVKGFITPEFQSQLEGLSRIFSEQVKEEYSGITTKVLSINIESFDDTSAVIVAKTQRQQESSGAGAETFYQDARVNLTKGQDGWLVEGAEWLDAY